jgi:hypothetical protein
MGCPPRNRQFYRPLLADVHHVVSEWEQKLTTWQRREVLMTLFLAGAIAAGFGVVVWLSVRIEEPPYRPNNTSNLAAIVAVLESHGAIVGYHPSGQVRRVVAQSPRFDDADLVLLSRLPGLQTVLIVESPVTDDGLMKLRTLTQLQSVHLIDTQVTETGRRALQAALPQADVRVMRTAGGSR